MAFEPGRFRSRYELELALGSIDGKSKLCKFGQNQAVPNGAFEPIWSGSTAYLGFLTASSKLRIAAGGNANDTAAGTGARSVRILGLGGAWADDDEVLVTAGAAASADSVSSYIRNFRAYVEDCGTYTAGATVGANAGDIVIETNPGGVAVARIEALEGQTQMAIYTVPAGKTAYLVYYEIDVSSTRSVDVRFYKRERADVIAAPFGPRRLVRSYDGVDGVISASPRCFESFPEKTDIWWEASGNGGSASVAVNFDLWLIDN